MCWGPLVTRHTSHVTRHTPRCFKLKNTANVHSQISSSSSISRKLLPEAAASFSKPGEATLFLPTFQRAKTCRRRHRATLQRAIDIVKFLHKIVIMRFDTLGNTTASSGQGQPPNLVF